MEKNKLIFVKFKPFTMGEISRLWNKAGAMNLHSSNPEPFTWDELTELIGINPLLSLNNSTLEYTSSQGDVELRELIINQFYSDLRSADDVILTSGAQEGIFVLMNALLKPGDQVIGFTPCFEPLVQVAQETGADVNFLPLDSNNDWQINWHELEETINHNTKLLIINFPHNPTGTHITENEFNKLIDLCKKYDCWLFSDEVFRGLEHEPDDQLLAAVDLYDKAVSMGVMSKSLALPGIRLGWLTIQNKKLKQSVMNVKAHLSICQSALDTQIAQIIIPQTNLILQRNRQIIKRNKNTLDQLLVNHQELHWHSPKAAATGFIQFKPHRADKVIKQWVDEYHFMVMPGRAFVTEEEGFRITLGTTGVEDKYQKIVDYT